MNPLFRDPNKKFVCMSESERIYSLLHRIEVLEFEVKLLNAKLNGGKKVLK